MTGGWRPRRRIPLRCNIWVDRNGEFKDGTTRLIRGRRQPPAVSFDDRTADRQPQPQTAGLCRVEGVEKALESRRRQSGTRISHPHEHAARLRLLAADEQLSRPVVYAA